MATTAAATISPTSVSTAGRELLLELKRHQSGGGSTGSTGAIGSTGATAASGGGLPPPYNLKLVRQCLEDLQASFQRLSEEVAAASAASSTFTDREDPDMESSLQRQQAQAQAQQKPSMAARPSMLWHHACIQRHKRCLLAYHFHRLEALTKVAANHPTVTADTIQQQQWSTNGSELDVLQSYQQLRKEYVDSLAIPGLTVSDLIPTAPPPCSGSMSNSWQVRCLQTLGQVVLESGRSITLQKGSLLYLPRSDVLELLQEGILELVEGEEVDF